MFRSSRLLAVVASLGLVFAASVPALAQEGIKIAVVNTNQVLSQIKEFKDMRQRMTDKGNSLNQQGVAKKAAAQALEEARNQYKPDSQQYAEKNDEFIHEMIAFQTWGQVQQADINREKKQLLKTMFDKLEAATAEVAKQKGIDLVLTDQRSDIPQQVVDTVTEEKLSDALKLRIVLYAASKADLTNDVIAYMDKNYKAPAASAAPTGAAAPAGK